MADAFALFSGSPLTETSVVKPKKKRKLVRKTGSNAKQSTPYKVLGTFGEVECKKRRTQQLENKTSSDSNGSVNNFVSIYLRDCFEEKSLYPSYKTNPPELNVLTSTSNANTWETALHVNNQSGNIETNSFQNANNNPQEQTSVSFGGNNHPTASNAPDDVMQTAKLTNGTANLDSFSLILNDIIESSNQFESNNSSQSSQEYPIPITSSQVTVPVTAHTNIDLFVARQQRQGNPVQTQTKNEQSVSTGIPMASSCIPKANVVYPNITTGSKGSIPTYSTRGIDFLTDSDEAISRFFHQANPSSISKRIPEQTIYKTESNYINPSHQNINVQPQIVYTQPASTNQPTQQAYIELHQNFSRKSKSQTLKTQLAYAKQKELTQTSLMPQTAIMTAIQQQSNTPTQSDYLQQASTNPSKIQNTLAQEALRLSPPQRSQSMAHQAYITPSKQELIQVLTRKARGQQALRQSPPIQQLLTSSCTQPLQTAYSQSAPTQNSYRHQAQQQYAQLAPTQPFLTQPQYSQTAPTLPQYTQPSLTQSQYSQPSLTQPQYSQPSLTQPQNSQPSLTQPQYSQPSLTQPQYSQPAPTLPQFTQPALTQPQFTQPALTQLAPTQPQTLNHLPTASINNKERLDAKKRELEYYLIATSFTPASDSYTPAAAMNSSQPKPSHSPTPNLASPSDRLPQRSTITSSPDPSLSSYQVSDASSPQAEDDLSSADSFYLNTLPSLCFA
ncbi:bromodomain-containing protein -like isoform X1 [Biomphalaria pfeifferi]|uniref:Bromodomain-containing protein -like isoform X1 n=1 Tax=Biomphalaria pfeifferi TaxID=112525 RepID=A0AAD8EXM3_BIOPF|nr:bromodomain-containing protein -like isoform X1 [Biomphalaria pfeifferi]